MPPKAQDKKVAAKQVIRVHERKKKHEEGEGNSERWLLTYADMITLLLALFIILFAISTPNKVKYDQLAKEMSGGFGGESPTNTPAHGPAPGKVSEQAPSTNAAKAKTPKSAAAKAAAAAAAQKALAAKIKAAAAKQHMQKQVIVKQTARGLVISLLTDRATFASGSAVLEPSAKALLHAIGPFLSHIQNEIRVEGNTDNIPIATADYPTNWELSTARAVVVTRFLSEQAQIQPERLSAAGYGQYRPQESNDSEAHRQLNRRVDIVILNSRLTEETEKSQSDDVGTVTR